MDAVTISPKFQVVIPRAIRERLGLAAGQKVQVIAVDGRIQLIPVRPAKKLRGLLRGIDTSVPRDPDRL
jgi:AbrB family looped-hinge helix DNA binding protein